MRTHGHSRNGRRTPTYKTWQSMKDRCSLRSMENYERYGGRGVSFCARWARFENFLADMGERPDGKTLDRIDNSKGYEPGNCRWATLREQGANMRTTRSIEHNGRRMIMSEWAREIGVAPKVLWYRLEVGWPLHKVLTPSTRHAPEGK